MQHQVRDAPPPPADPVGHPHRSLSVHEGHSRSGEADSPTSTRRITQFGEYHRRRSLPNGHTRVGHANPPFRAALAKLGCNTATPALTPWFRRVVSRNGGG